MPERTGWHGQQRDSACLRVVSLDSSSGSAVGRSPRRSPTARSVDAVLVFPFCSREWRAGVPARLVWVAKRNAGSDLRH